MLKKELDQKDEELKKKQILSYELGIGEAGKKKGRKEERKESINFESKRRDLRCFDIWEIKPKTSHN